MYASDLVSDEKIDENTSATCSESSPKSFVKIDEYVAKDTEIDLSVTFAASSLTENSNAIENNCFKTLKFGASVEPR